MIRNDCFLSRQDDLMRLAIDAEINQHWCQAAMLWRRLGDKISALTCEMMAQHFAEYNNYTE